MELFKLVSYFALICVKKCKHKDVYLFPFLPLKVHMKYQKIHFSYSPLFLINVVVFEWLALSIIFQQLSSNIMRSCQKENVVTKCPLKYFFLKKKKIFHCYSKVGWHLHLTENVAFYTLVTFGLWSLKLFYLIVSFLHLTALNCATLGSFPMAPRSLKMSKRISEH